MASLKSNMRVVIVHHITQFVFLLKGRKMIAQYVMCKPKNPRSIKWRAQKLNQNSVTEKELI